MTPPSLVVITLVSLVLAISTASCDDRDAPAEPTSAATSTPVAVQTVASELPVISLQARAQRLTVEVAQSPEARALGLGGRSSMDADAGMLFDSGSNRVPSFSMRGMQFALDFIWIDQNKRIIGIDADAQPEPGVANADLRRYSPGVEVRYVLELNAGTAARLGLSAGDQLEFEIPSTQ